MNEGINTGIDEGIGMIYTTTNEYTFDVTLGDRPHRQPVRL